MVFVELFFVVHRGHCRVALSMRWVFSLPSGVCVIATDLYSM
jgi:hypothetical protein